MDEARAVLDRLSRIESLDREAAPAGELLEELRDLLREAETWLRAEPDPQGAVEALAGCRRAWRLSTAGGDASGFATLTITNPEGGAVRLFRHTESVQDSPVPGRTTGCVCA